MSLHIARDHEVARLWPALAASRLFATPEDLDRFRAAGPWRVLVDDSGRAAVLERWREHMDILGIKGVWCAERDLAALLEDVRAVAREQGFARVMSPLIAEETARPYVSAGMEAIERIVALRSNTRGMKGGLEAEMPQDVELLLADTRSLESLRAVDEACFPPFWRYGPEAIRAMLEDGRVVVATESGQVIGYTWCTIDRGIGTLGRLAVLPQGRHRGVGSAILDDALGFMKRGGAELVSLCTQEDNDASRALYARQGLRELPGRLVFLAREA